MKRTLRNVLGFVFLFLGGIGIFLPVLPTTPFVFAAAGCFAGNEKMLNYIKKSKLFSDYITNFRERNGLKKGTVIKSLVFLWVAMGISVFHIRALWAYFLLPAIGILVTVHIIYMALPKPKNEKQKLKRTFKLEVKRDKKA